MLKHFIKKFTLFKVFTNLIGHKFDMFIMKLLIINFFLLLTVGLRYSLAAESFIIPPDSPVSEDLLYERQHNRKIFTEVIHANIDREEKLIQKIRRKSNLVGKLGKIKYSILNGNLERAKVDLLRLSEKEPFVRIIRKRYQAIIYFLTGKYDKSIEVLSDPKFNTLDMFAKTCHLKVLNMVILDKQINLKKIWKKCKKYTKHHETTKALWFDNLVQLRTNKKNYLAKHKIKRLKSLGYEEKFIKLYLKLSLYMNQEDTILKFIQELPAEYFLNDEIREIMGHLYYRKGKLGVSFDFLEDLKTVNAENIKGNIYLAQEKYELAYAQFKLALNQKQDSYNAIERALPLSWILAQWNDGVDFSQRMYRSESNKNKKLAVLTAFYLQLGKYKEALKNLEELTVFAKYSQPFEINQLYAYTSLVNNDINKMKIYADYSCRKLDAMNCWLLIQTSMWEDFSKTIERTDEVSSDATSLLTSLKNNIYDQPIDEDNFIDQFDIEELDDKLINITN
jgi:hypothetical protein